MLLLVSPALLCCADDDDEARNPTAAVAKDHDHEAGEPTEVTLTPEVIRHFQITTVRIEPLALREPVIAPGTVAFVPETTAHIGTVVLGRVAVIHVQVGDMVKAGDPLITIDSPELGLAQNDWLQKRATIAVAQAEVSIAERAHQRAQVLVKDDGISVGEAQRREGDLLKAQANRIAAQAAVQAAENIMRIHGMDQEAIEALGKSGQVSTRLVIRAPSSGTIIHSNVALGEVVRPETESVMTIADTARLVVLAQVPASQANLVSVGSTARITATALPEKQVDGTVSAIAPQIDDDTRTRSVRIPLAGDAGLTAGTFVEVMIIPAPTAGGTEAKVLAVPREAVFTFGGAPVVFVSDDEPNTYRMKKIAIGPAVGSLVPVISGLDGKEAVVAHGGFILKAEFGKADAEHEH
jgi:cobalt-zinc-cadmium efflux system membrane fusion protein